MASTNGLEPKRNGIWQGRLVIIAFVLALIAVWGAAREGAISAPVTILAVVVAAIVFTVIQVRRWRRG